MSKEEIKIYEEEFNKIFAKNLRYYLEKNNMTQLELSQKLGVGTTSVYNWCNAVKTPRIDKVDKMCSIFGIRRSDLMEDKNQNIDFLYSDDNVEFLIEIQKRAKEASFVSRMKKYMSLIEADRKSVDDMIEYLDSKNKKEAD